MSESERKEFDFQKALWQVCTVVSSNEQEQREIVRREISSWEDNSIAYTAPFTPWIALLLGRSYVFRSRRAGTAPCLVSEVMFVSDVLHLLLAHTVEEEFSEHEFVLELMGKLAQQDPQGPWDKGMTWDEETMKALAAIIKHVHVFLPNRFLMEHNVTVCGVCIQCRSLSLLCV